MKTNNTTLRSEIQLPDLELKIEIYKIIGRAYYKVFHQEDEILSDFDILGITFDLKGAITLLTHLALNKKVDGHEKLSGYLVEYEDENGIGPRTEYFQRAFKPYTV